MRHGDAGLYALAGAMVVSGGLLAACYADAGRSASPDGGQEVSAVDPDGEEATGDSVTSGDGGDAAEGNGRGGSPYVGASMYPPSETVPSSTPPSKRKNETQKKGMEKRETLVSGSEGKAVTDAVRKALGGESPASCRSILTEWDGGDGNMLVVTAYAEDSAYADAKSLGKAFGTLMADVVDVAGTEFDDVEIISVTLYGAEGTGKMTAFSASPSADDLSWVAHASVDVPSQQDGAIGDVNRATVLYGEELTEIDMTEFGFSDLPQEE